MVLDMASPQKCAEFTQGGELSPSISQPLASLDAHQASMYQIDASTNPKHFPSHPSLVWKITHATCYSFGAVLFTVGSIMFFPSEDHPTFGAVLFIIGSVVFVYGDTMEWMNNRVVRLLYMIDNI